MAAEHDEAYERNKFEPSKGSPAMRTVRSATDHCVVEQKMLAIVTHRNNVQKTPDYKAKDKKDEPHHGSHSTRQSKIPP